MQKLKEILNIFKMNLDQVLYFLFHVQYNNTSSASIKKFQAIDHIYPTKYSQNNIDQLIKIVNIITDKKNKQKKNLFMSIKFLEKDTTNKWQKYNIGSSIKTKIQRFTFCFKERNAILGVDNSITQIFNISFSKDFSLQLFWI